MLAIAIGGVRVLAEKAYHPSRWLSATASACRMQQQLVPTQDAFRECHCNSPDDNRYMGCNKCLHQTTVAKHIISACPLKFWIRQNPGNQLWLPHWMRNQYYRCGRYAEAFGIRVLKRSHAPMLNVTNAQMHKCTNARMHKCTNAQIHKCTSAQVNPTETTWHAWTTPFSTNWQALVC